MGVGGGAQRGGADAEPGGTGWEAPGGEGVSRDQASRVGCFPGGGAEGALSRFLCVPTPWRQAVTVAPFSLSPALSLSAPQSPGSRGMEAGLWHQGSRAELYTAVPSAVVQCAFLRAPLA